MKPRPIALITLLSLFIALPLNTFKAEAQQPNPPYLSQFPPVDKVLNAMKTSDARETAIRQLGAFYQLVEIIKTLSGRREFRGLTPDEQRVIGMYQTASYNLVQAASHFLKYLSMVKRRIFILAAGIAGSASREFQPFSCFLQQSKQSLIESLRLTMTVDRRVNRPTKIRYRSSRVHQKLSPAARPNSDAVSSLEEV